MVRLSCNIFLDKELEEKIDNLTEEVYKIEASINDLEDNDQTIMYIN